MSDCIAVAWAGIGCGAAAKTPVRRAPAGRQLAADAFQACDSDAWGEAGSADAESDETLIRACLADDGDSYARLVSRYEGAVARILWAFTRDRQVLEELVQDTFVEVYFSLSRFRKGAPFYPWLRVVATRVGYRHWRRLRRERDRREKLAVWHRETAPGPASPDPSDTAEYVYRVLARLDAKDRLVLTLQYFEGCTVREIAARMGWTVSLVKVRAHRARRKLQGLLQELEEARHGTP